MVLLFAMILTDEEYCRAISMSCISCIFVLSCKFVYFKCCDFCVFLLWQPEWSVYMFLQFLSSMRRRLDDPELCSSDVIFNMMLMYREIQVRQFPRFHSGETNLCLYDW